MTPARLTFDIVAGVGDLARRVAADAPDLDGPAGPEGDLAYVVFYAAVAARDGWTGRLARAVRAAACQQILDDCPDH